MTNNNIMVSVSMITYKHELYIREAIEGVLMQQVNFPVELIIADDCSPDNTSLIVQEIIENHPNGHWIKYFRHPQNIGMQPNGLFASQQCLGKYIAVCEGDDYWTDSLKLQKQVDFLETNPKFNICGHSVKCTVFNDLLTKKLISNKNKKFSLKEVIFKNPIHTSSFCFKNNLKFKENKAFWEVSPLGDYPLLVLASQPYGVYMFKDIMSVYRNDNEFSAWTGKLTNEAQIEKKINTVKLMLESKQFSSQSKVFLQSFLAGKQISIIKKILIKIYKRLHI